MLLAPSRPEALLSRYAGAFPVEPLGYGTVRDYCDSCDGVPELAAVQGDLKDIQRPWTVKAILGLVPPGGRVLEVGGGEPLVAGALAELGYDATLVDPYDGSGRGPQEYEYYVTNFPKVRIVRQLFGPGLAELAGERFDAIFSVSVLEHVPPGATLDGLFQGIAEHLVPGGWSLHCVDCVARGEADAFHLAQCVRVLAWQERLAGRDEVNNAAGEISALVLRAQGDLETYYLSAEGHNRWRGAMPYADFPYRRVLSVQFAERKPAGDPSDDAAPVVAGA